jgi:hypothetical protein
MRGDDDSRRVTPIDLRPQCTPPGQVNWRYPGESKLASKLRFYSEVGQYHLGRCKSRFSPSFSTERSLGHQAYVLATEFLSGNCVFQRVRSGLVKERVQLPYELLVSTRFDIQAERFLSCISNDKISDGEHYSLLNETDSLL